MRGDATLVPRLAVLGLATLAAIELARVVRAHASFPLWDEAAHGVAGLEVADALRHFNPIELFLALNRQAVWPFVHSLLLAPFFLFGGPGFGSAEAASLVLFVASAVLIFLAGRALHPTRGTWVGLAAAALLLTAPTFRLHATLVMLEMPGAALVLLAFVLHAHSSREPFVPRRLLLAGLATTAVFLCKYNYGILWLAPLLVAEWRALPAADRARARAAVRARMTARWWLRPMPAILGLGALVALGIAVTGGGETTLFGARISARSPGNLAWALFLLALGWLLVPRRALPTRARWLAERLPERFRVLARSVALPLAVWFALPPHLKEFFGFVTNRESGPALWSGEGLAFYPRAMAADYSAAFWVGWSALALAALAPWPWIRDRAGRGRVATHPDDVAARANRAAEVAVLAAAFGFVLVAGHRYRESRFFFTVAPFVWLCAARTLVTLADGVLGRIAFRPLRESLWAGLGAAALLAAWVAAPLATDVAARREAFRAPASIAPALDAVLDGISPRLVAPDFVVAAFEPAPAPDANADYPPRAVLLGSSNVMSPGLVAWWAHIARPEIPRAALPKRAPFLPPGAEDVELDARARWVDEHADVAIAAFADVLPRPIVGEYRNETWADRETEARIAESGTWAKRSQSRSLGWRVTVYDRAR